jgi:DNA polymerase sigma
MLEDCQPCLEINPQRYDKFFDLLENEMKNKVKEIDQLKDSVRKERQGFIQIMEDIVKETFQNKFGNGFVGIKIFGSMATELAIETSDVDLVVTGINQASHHGHGYRHEHQGKHQLLRMMQILNDNLTTLKDEKKIESIKFLQSASVPIIKLVVDLQMINEWQIDTRLRELKQERMESSDYNEDFANEKIDLRQMGLDKKNIDPKVRFLKVDISIDEQSESYQKNNKFGDHNLNVPSRTHSGIDTIYHI